MTNPNDPQFAEPHTQVGSYADPGYWNASDIEPAPPAPLKRERIFPRKVLIGWALATAAVYFGIQVAKVAIREAVKQAAVYTTGVETTPDNREVIYTTPNGKMIITKDRVTGQITIRKGPNMHPIPPRAPTPATAPTRVNPDGPPDPLAAPPAPPAATKR